MITETRKWHFLVVKNISTLLHGLMSKHNYDRYCVNCLHTFRTESKTKSHEVCKNHHNCHVKMSEARTKILK